MVLFQRPLSPQFSRVIKIDVQFNVCFKVISVSCKLLCLIAAEYKGRDSISPRGNFSASQVCCYILTVYLLFAV